VVMIASVFSRGLKKHRWEYSPTSQVRISSGYVVASPILSSNRNDQEHLQLALFSSPASLPLPRLPPLARFSNYSPQQKVNATLESIPLDLGFTRTWWRFGTSAKTSDNVCDIPGSSPPAVAISDCKFAPILIDVFKIMYCHGGTLRPISARWARIASKSAWTFSPYAILITAR